MYMYEEEMSYTHHCMIQLKFSSRDAGSCMAFVHLILRGWKEKLLMHVRCIRCVSQSDAPSLNYLVPTGKSCMLFILCATYIHRYYTLISMVYHAWILELQR